jgi:hypothetical protein
MGHSVTDTHVFMTQFVLIKSIEMTLIKMPIDLFVRGFDYVLVYSIFCGNKGMSSSVSNVDCYVMVRKALDFIFNRLLVLMGQWEIQMYLCKTFLSSGCLWKVCTLVCRVGGFYVFF